MPPIYQELEIEWEGKSYTVHPTYQLVQRIEQKVSIAGIVDRATAGDAPFSHLAYVLASALQFAGCRHVTPEDVYLELYSAPDVAQLALQVAMAFMPQRAPRGNDEPPDQGGKQTKKKPKSTGRSTTK